MHELRPSMRTVVVALVLVAGCTGETGPVTVVDAGAEAGSDRPPVASPTVVATTPRHGELEVEPGAVIEARFSVSMAAETFTSSSFTLQRDGVPIAGAVEYDASYYDPTRRVARFRPEVPIEPLGTYTATLTPAVTASDGAAMAAAYAWTFTTSARGWDTGPAELGLAGDLAMTSHGLAVATSPSGVVTAAWQRWPAIGRVELWAGRLEPGTGWQTPVLLGTAHSDAQTPQVAVSAAGHAIVLWQAAMTSDRPILRAARFAPGAGWSPLERLEPDAAEAAEYGPDAAVTMDAAGNATVVGGGARVWARRLRADGTWQAAVVLQDAAAGFPRVVVDPAGTVTAAWVHGHGGGWHLSSSRFTEGDGWSHPVPLAAAPHGDRGELAVDDGGVVTAIWRRDGAGGASMLFSRRFDDGAWGPSAMIELGFLVGARVVADPTGAVTAVWRNEHGLGLAARFTAAAGWEAPLVVTSAGRGLPSIDVDARGTVVTAWLTYTSWQAGTEALSLVARRFVPATGWGPITVVKSDVSGQDLQPQVTVSPAGTAVLMWNMPVDPSTTGDQRELWVSVRR